MKAITPPLALSVATAVLLAPAAFAQRDLSQVEIQSREVGPGVYMLTGAGGNMGLCVGKDATFLIDDQFGPLSEKIIAAVAKLTDKPVRFVVNTHWHGDHTGGNENIGKTGALIVAHENVRRRMSVAQFDKAFNDTTPPSPEGALPVVTFADSVTFHLNGQEIAVMHVRPAHTDGDAVIHFRGSNVIHMGDLFFNGTYPLIDVSSGGSIQGYIDDLDRLIPTLPADIRIIPGHGPLSNRAGLVAFRDMLEDVAGEVRKAVDAGRTREETIALKPTAKWDAKWGGGFMKPDLFTGIVWDDLSRSVR